MATFRDLVSLVSQSIEAYGPRKLFGVERGGAWQWMTYGELGQQAARLRAALTRLGIKRGDRIGVVSSNRPEWGVVTVAAHGLGAVCVPMYEVQLEKDWAYILRDSGAKLCFASTPAIAAKIRAMRGELPSLTHVIGFESEKDDDTSFAHLLKDAPTVPAITPEEGEVAMFIYTSGTTGKPKGVKLTHGALARTASAMREVWHPEAGDRTVSILPWAHVGGFFELMVTLSGGAGTALPDALEKIPAAIAATKPTSIVGVPRIWNKFYDAIHKGIAEKPKPIQWLFHAGIAAQRKRNAGKKLRRRERIAARLAKRILFPKVLAKLGGELKIAVTGAAALSKEVAEFFEALGVTVIDIYGQTEVSAVATANKPGASRIGSVGRPLPGVEIRIDRVAASADDGSGEIVIYSPGSMLEYHGLPEETAAVVMPDGGIRTGDLGYLDPDGFLYITGRVREVYKLENGKFVTPVPIEEKITLSPYIAQAMVFGLNRPHNVALLVADVAALRRWCEEQSIAAQGTEAILREPRVRALMAREIETHTHGFKGYERVKDFVLLAEEWSTANDMLTPSMKLKRRNVMSRYGAEIDALYGARP